MAFESGGQGLWSTVDDFLTFARLFIGAGAVDSVRILKPATMKLMITNRLSEPQRMSARMLGRALFTSHGFGLGVAIVLDPDKAPAIQCKGAIGTVGWPGAYGGWWQADPANQSIMIFLAHNALDLKQMAKGIGLGVYSAISEFHAARHPENLGLIGDDAA
jgi:CubicO group peptidase (beta-lactamase class C family)